MDRLTPEGYDSFYRDGTYRAISSLFIGQDQNLQSIKTDQVRYAKGLIRALAGYLRFKRGARFLDIGGSTGQVGFEFQTFFDGKATVLDPAEEEIAAAERLGVEGIVGSFETWRSLEKFDLVLLCRSIEHVHDLRAVLSKIRELLRPNGYLYCDIIDFTEACRMIGHPEAVTKIDHCYWLTQESALTIFRLTGFEVVSMNLSFQQPLLGFLLRSSEPADWVSADRLWVQQQLREIQEIATVWQESGRDPVDLKDSLRRRAYIIKRALTRWF